MCQVPIIRAASSPRGTALLATLLLSFAGACGSNKTELPEDQQTLQLRFAPTPPRVGEARLTIDVRCGCVVESNNGPAYDFVIEGERTRITQPPVYDAEADAYQATLAFDGPGARSLTVEVLDGGQQVRKRTIHVEVEP